MKVFGGSILLVAWIIQNIFMAGYISNKGEIDSIENTRGVEQGYMLYLQFEFIKESKKPMPCLEILHNAGKNYLICMGHITDMGEIKYGLHNSRGNTNIIIGKLERFESIIKRAQNKVWTANYDPNLKLDRTYRNVYDPELIRSELNEIYDLIYTSFKDYQIAGSERAEFAGISLDSLDNKYGVMYNLFIVLYIIGAVALIYDEGRSRYIKMKTKQPNEVDSQPRE